ncbi:MAG: ferrous iron transport protein B [Bacteroidales bacterium]|nr:ferrous iron transport protein B [Bacteroidales bacterium]MDZ4203997.1 ferrous iron transport protein B [Bacteroidales bacterium]
MNLQQLDIGEKAIIIKVKGRGAFRKRIIEMGFVAGQEIVAVQKAPLGDPVEYNIMGYNVSLRNSEAGLIEIVTENLAHEEVLDNDFIGMPGDLLLKETARRKGKTIHVALVGNPNSGKTTLYNFASHSRERVGNYGGVTVDAKEARFKLDDYQFIITDLPGTYSLTAYSPEELYVRDFIFGQMPDVIVNIVDASNLERNLYLTTQLIDMDIKVVVALNMYDDLKRRGDDLDYDYLGNLLGIPFVPTIASRGKGIDELFHKIIDVYEDRETIIRHVHINYRESIEKGIKALQEKIKTPDNSFITNNISPRFLSIKLIEKDKHTRKRLAACSNIDEIFLSADQQVIRIEKELEDDTESLITDARYGFIAGALRETFTPSPDKYVRRSDLVDQLITHRFWSIPIFVFFMWITFYSTFKLGQYPMNWIEGSVDFISGFVMNNMSEGWLKDLLIQGLVGGVGGVIVFLPNILLLYFFISLMEDTGYMARAVFIMDKFMHRIGLHGKSFIPLIMGFGCNVPAILSTRIIESRRDRLITMLINPFMSCSARLPVYVLFITAFFTSYQGSILFSLYALGILLAIGSSLLFRRTFFRKVEIPFVMELPPYRVPTVRTLIKHMWFRTEQYLRKIAGVILVASIVIWALGYFPQPDSTPADGNISENQAVAKPQQIEQQAWIEQEYERQHNSYIGRIGRFIEPVMRPLGFDWRMSVALLTGVAAKEVVVGSLGVLYLENPDNLQSSASLVKKLQNQTHQSGTLAGQEIFNPIIAFSFMLFILIYFPCIGVIAAIRKESGSWKWAVFVIFYTTILAWLASFSFYQLANIIVK